MSRMTRQHASRGILPPPQEIMQKLEKSVNDGNAYGALQLYKTYSARYAAAEKYNDALDLLEAGAILQLNHSEVTSGAELATLFVEILVKGKYPFSEETLDRIRKIYQAFPKLPMPQHLIDHDDDDMEKLSEALVAAKTRVEVCSSFLKSAIRWSAEYGASKSGCPELHYMLAEYIYSESPELDMAKVTVHFVRGNNPEKFASTLTNFMGKCYPGEDDLAIARAVLMYLSQGNLRDANKLMGELRKQLKAKQQTLPNSDLIQFVVYLLETLERDALPLFRMLRQKYKSSIDRERLFDELLDDIAEKFYGVRRQAAFPGMFGDIFKMMDMQL
ncbi:Golgi to ER traffic protein 4 homolog [Dendrobium catenatum]|uniref:Uncharacterized protein n=1 Tax=Dendrobium catenatum TaxID=906689 RepID=A0A2I0XGA5_9ASPA|nr:Golgi to ER traffic protein 4 homolog [Dendrobium catenatum]PKU86947.1 hypothetical protein MA16_Dca017847 [Dendrobium catenatum]